MNNLPNTANTLLDQKRSRKIDTDLDSIEMQPSSLSSTFGFRSQVKFNQPFFPVPVKKMSIDLADQSQPKFVGCNCKNSQCLKRYCECFTRMKYCDPLICSCKNCYNTIDKEKERNEAIHSYMMKSPISFKKINMSEYQLVCSCKKSYCLKKYCECFQAGMKCTANCKCVDCHNKNSYEKKLFSVSGATSEKRERFYSLDSTASSRQKLEYKTVLVEPEQIIIDNYDVNKKIENLLQGQNNGI